MSTFTGNAFREYIIGGYNITRFVIQTNMPSAMQVKSEWGSFPDTPRLEFEVTNQNGQFSTLGELSLLRGVILQNTTVQVIQTQGSTEILEWEGIIENAIENHRTQRVKIIGISPLSRDLDSPALLTLGTNTPARLSELVFIAFDIEVDSASYAKADDFLSTLVTAQIDPNLLESRITLMELQKQLATAGFGRIYYFDGKMRYEVFQTLSPTITPVFFCNTVKYPACKCAQINS